MSVPFYQDNAPERRTEMNSKKRVLVTCGPIPARVDSVKYLTNMFKGGLAFKTAAWLSGNKDFEVSVLCWKYTKVPDNMPQEIRVDTVNDVLSIMTGSRQMPKL